MAGAMRLGELTHLMESRLTFGDALTATTPELFEALEADLDHIAYVLERLHKGELTWGPLGHNTTLHVLHNPRYAGAFFFGRSRHRTNAPQQQ